MNGYIHYRNLNYDTLTVTITAITMAITTTTSKSYTISNVSNDYKYSQYCLISILFILAVTRKFVSIAYADIDMSSCPVFMITIVEVSLNLPSYALATESSIS